MEAIHAAEATVQGLAVVLLAFALFALIIFAVDAIAAYRKDRT